MLVIFGLIFAIFAVIHLATFAWCVFELRKDQKRGELPRPGLRFRTDMAGTMGILSTVVALLIFARWAVVADGWWKLAPLIMANVVIQPLCAWLMVAGTLTLWHTLRGRLVYALRMIPDEAIPLERRRGFWIHRLVSGVAAIALGYGLSCATLQPML